jgi:hypothetical protein
VNVAPVHIRPPTQTELDQLHEGLWGQLNLRQLAERGYQSVLTTERQVALRTHRINFFITVKNHRGETSPKLYRLPDRVFCAHYDITDTETLLVRDQGSLLQSIVRGLIRGLGPDIYEYDPRIGHTEPSPGTTTLPACPLLEPRPFKQQPYWDSFRPDVQYPNHTDCPLCGESFSEWALPMWGGGNVQWVHLECWGSDLPTEA